MPTTITISFIENFRNFKNYIRYNIHWNWNLYGRKESKIISVFHAL